MYLGNIVDVIIPVYNQFSLVKRCINSVLNAKNKIKVEIIVINDCSTESDLNNYLVYLKDNKLITLITNKKNLGFTKNVNLGMKLHSSRDVILLNSDTCVYGNWIDRLTLTSYSEVNIASSIPLSNACHISNYPRREGNNNVTLEINDEDLDKLASQLPFQYVKVPTTVGFCMHIKRSALDSIGFFDEYNFPIGYGEESDFCYRARKVGWHHAVAGNIFVTHQEGSPSFANKKAQLMEKMLRKFITLHPDLPHEDNKLLRFDPVGVLRSHLDIARLKKALKGTESLKIFFDPDEGILHETYDFSLLFSPSNNVIKFSSDSIKNFPNLRSYVMPKEIILFNTLMNYLGVKKFFFNSQKEKDFFNHQVSSLSFEHKLAPSLKVIT